MELADQDHCQKTKIKWNQTTKFCEKFHQADKQYVIFGCIRVINTND